MEKICIVKRRKMTCDGDTHTPLPRTPLPRPALREPSAAPARVVSIELTPEQARAVRSNGNFQQRYGADTGHIVFNVHLDDAPGPRMVTPKMLRAMLQVSAHTISKLIKTGALRSYKIGRLRRFSYEDVIDYLGRSLAGGTVTRLRVELTSLRENGNHPLQT